MIELQGRKALISGAAQGLGRAIAGLFVERGAQVMLADIDEAGAAKAADELGPMARSVRCDVTKAADWARAVAAVSVVCVRDNSGQWLAVECRCGPHAEHPECL